MPSKENVLVYTNIDKNVGLLDKLGNDISPAFADKILSFDNNIIIAETNGDLICFESNGTPTLPKGYNVSDLVIKNKTNGKFGVIDNKGIIKLYPTYNKVSNVTSNSAIVEFEGKYGVVKF